MAVCAQPLALAMELANHGSLTRLIEVEKEGKEEEGKGEERGKRKKE